MLHCDSVCGGGVEEEQWRLLHSLLDFSHSLHYPQSNWTPLVLSPKWVGLCTLKDPVGLSNKLSCEAGSFSCCCLNPHRCFQRLEALFLHAGALGCAVCLTPPLFLLVLSMWKCGAAGSASHYLVGCARCSLACPIPQSITSLRAPAAALP